MYAAPVACQPPSFVRLLSYLHVFFLTTFRPPSGVPRSAMALAKALDDDDKFMQHLSERELGAEASVKPGDKTEDTLRINRGAIRVSSPNPSLVSIADSNHIRLGRNPDYDPLYHERRVSRSPAPLRTFKGRSQVFWKSNKGLALVLISQLFGTLMNVTTRMLEMEGNNGRRSSPSDSLGC
jgi:hypothetical protein